MSLETIAGPRQVTMAAQRLQECPYSSPSATLADIVGNHTYAVERLLKFAGLKVLTDELAVRLPNMVSKYPPYGLPPIEEDEPGDDPLEPQEVIVPDTPLRRALAELNKQYDAKMERHAEEELTTMVGDLELQQILGVAGSAKMQIEDGSINAINTMTGLLAIMPGVLGPETSHDEIVTVARNSRRLPIMPSLFDRQELDAFRVAATEGIPATQGNTYKLAPWGWAFNPALFTAYSDSRTHKTYMDYAGGVDSIDIAEYWEWEDRLAEEYLAHMPPLLQSSVIPKSIKKSRPTTIGTLRDTRSRALTCPARQLILATWTDIINIVDQERMFELES